MPDRVGLGGGEEEWFSESEGWGPEVEWKGGEAQNLAFFSTPIPFSSVFLSLGWSSFARLGWPRLRGHNSMRRPMVRMEWEGKQERNFGRVPLRANSNSTNAANFVFQLRPISKYVMFLNKASSNTK